MERRGFLERAEREDAWIGNGSDEEPEVRLFSREKLGNVIGQRFDVVNRSSTVVLSISPASTVRMMTNAPGKARVRSGG